MALDRGKRWAYDHVLFEGLRLEDGLLCFSSASSGTLTEITWDRETAASSCMACLVRHSHDIVKIGSEMIKTSGSPFRCQDSSVIRLARRQIAFVGWAMDGPS